MMGQTPLSDKQKQLLEIYGSFQNAGKQSRKYELEKQYKYEKALIKKFNKQSKDSTAAAFCETLAEYNENSYHLWRFGSYLSKTNFTMSQLIKGLTKTAVWSEYLNLQENYPNTPLRCALVFKCPNNGYNDLVLLGSAPVGLEDVPWYVTIKTDQTTPVILMTLSNLLKQL
jgi:hypothetical protein